MATSSSNPESGRRFTPANLLRGDAAGTRTGSSLPSTPRRASRSSLCQLVPPCKRGRHGYHFSPGANEHRSANILGKYHITEEGLLHDLGALKRGAVYRREDFLVRARAWYKAEIDRLFHLERVQEVFVFSLSLLVAVSGLIKNFRRQWKKSWRLPRRPSRKRKHSYSSNNKKAKRKTMRCKESSLMTRLKVKWNK
jgi:hypothetical protein